MSKAILRFNLPEEIEELETAQNGWKYQSQLEEIWQKVFRPYHKHGYADEKLNKLLNSKNGQYVIEQLEQLYREALNEAN